MSAHMESSAHVRLTEVRAPAPADEERARRVLTELRDAIKPFRDSERAVAAGYEPFLPSVPQEIYHFVNYPVTRLEYDQGRPFDASRPGSLLYRRKGDRWELVGAMYSASPLLTTEQLDALVPLSVARWHAHVNVCLPAGVTLHDLTQNRIGKPEAWAGKRFGFEGTIVDAEECKDAGGTFYPQAWGWMVHVYPFAGDDLAVAFAQDVP